MANLQKIVKVTQAQYNTLASGGTVGSYTGLNDNYIYLIEDTNTYITSNGGTLTGPLTVNTFEGGAIREEDEDGIDTAAIFGDYYSNEIIYNSEDHYQPLFATENYQLIYSDNGDYLSDFTFSTHALKIIDNSDTGTEMFFDVETAQIGHNKNGTYYYATLPEKTGTIALTSDIPTVNNATLTITQNSTSIGTFTANASSNVTIDVVTPKVYRYI